jgi:hypothetical protein
MQGWEYCHVFENFVVRYADAGKVEHKTDKPWQGVAQLGREGWEFVGVMVPGTMYFRRPLPN